MLCDGKGISLRLSLFASSSGPFRQRRSKRPRKNHYSFCGFLSSVQCTPSRTVYTERTYSHPQSGSGACYFFKKKRILSSTRSRVSWYCWRISTRSMMIDYEEDLDDLQLKTKKNRPDLWLEHIGQSRQISLQQEVESQRRFHLSLMDRRPGLSARSQSTTGWILQCLKQKTRSSTEEQTCRRRRNVQRTSWP